MSRRYRSPESLGTVKKKSLLMPERLALDMEHWAAANLVSFNDLVCRICRTYLDTKQRARELNQAG